MNIGLQRFGACCAFVSAGLFLIGLFVAGFLPALAPSLTPTELAAIYKTDQMGILFGGLLIVIASAALAGRIFSVERRAAARPVRAPLATAHASAAAQGTRSSTLLNRLAPAIRVITIGTLHMTCR